MTTPLTNEIVRALIAAVRRALEPGHGDRDVPAARDVAQVLGLDGLDRALDVCRPGDPGTDALERRLRALCDVAALEDTVQPFVDADPELGRMAVECGAVIEGAPGTPPDGTLTAAEALEDVPLVDEASRSVAGRVRLTPAVSAALRAALEWLCGDSSERVRLRTEDSALEIACARVNGAGIAAAEKVIAGVGGNLGPAAGTGRAAAPGAWFVRVPIATARPTFLMVSQGSLQVAIPWHAVLRLLMTPRARLDADVLSLGSAVLPPLVPLAGTPGEYPVVLLAHGLRRGWFVADRLVWRLPAEPCHAPAETRAAALAGAVRTEDGVVYRVLDTALQLDNVPPLVVPRFDETARAPESAPPEKPMIPAEPAPQPAPFVPALPHAAPSAALPLEAPFTPAERDEDLPEIDPARVTPLALRTLVAEDSISARLVLVRLLEQYGLEVTAVGTAGEMEEALAQGPWALVMIDVELPDAAGRALLDGVRARVREFAPRADVVALVRDAHDEGVAVAAGIARTLRKPWGGAAVARLLEDLDLPPQGAR